MEVDSDTMANCWLLGDRKVLLRYVGELCSLASAFAHCSISEHLHVCAGGVCEAAPVCVCGWCVRSSAGVCVLVVCAKRRRCVCAGGVCEAAPVCVCVCVCVC